MRDRLITGYLRAPEHPGKLRVVRALARTIIPDAGVVATVDDGLRLYLHPRDWIEYLLLKGTPYEPLTLGFMRANLRPGDAAVLAGVNFGLHVAVAASAVSRDGMVVGVEPQPAALMRARLNLDLNGLESRVRLVAAALGATEQLVSMAWANPENAGAASLLDQGNSFDISMVRIGTVLPILGGRPFRLLLLDVQGYELEVLAGADLEHGPEMMIVELDPEFLARAKSAPEQITQRLAAAGYDLYDILGGDALPRLLDLPERNLVAVRRGVDVRWPRLSAR